jgi:hypothetical protein
MRFDSFRLLFAEEPVGVTSCHITVERRFSQRTVSLGWSRRHFLSFTA